MNPATAVTVETGEALGYARAINAALAEEMRRDERVWMMGQDIGRMGGVFGVTRGLFDEFGPMRVRDTTINETFIVGGAGAEHSQSLEAMGMHVPGLKVALPATPADAKGLLKSAIRDPNPVLFFEHKGMYRVKGDVPTSEDYLVRFGEAAVRRTGDAATVVATGLMVPRALEAAEKLSAEGIELEVIDPRTLVPLDMETIVASVERTGRALVVQEAVRTGGAGAEIAARIQEAAFFALDAPVWRLGALDTPIPQDPDLEQLVIPSTAQIETAARELVAL